MDQVKLRQTNDENSVVIEFDNHRAAEHFRQWLDHQGEQDYWVWMEEREQEEIGPITATRFKYLPDGRITTLCDRLDKK